MNVNECTDGSFPHYCGPNTICTDTVGSFTCACKPGIIIITESQLVFIISSTQASPPGRPIAGVGTSTSAVLAVTPSVVTPAPGPRPPPASASTMRDHTLAAPAALRAPR